MNLNTFLRRLYIIAESSGEGCWDWHGGGNRYAPVRWSGATMQAHRLAYELFCGPLGSFYACHSCDNRRCVNPWHIFPGTALDNYRDCVAKGRMDASYASKRLPRPGRHKEHCKRGHAMDAANTFVSRDGRHHCRKCNVIRTIACNRRKHLSRQRTA